MSKWTKLGIRACLLVLAVVCFYVSYWHGVALCGAHGERRDAAHLIPAVGDALMIIASAKVLERRACHWRKRLFPSAAMYVGLLASLLVNMATADHSDPIGMAVSAWPALALWFAIELLVRPVSVAKSSGRRAPAAKRAPAKAPAGVPEKPAAPRRRAPRGAAKAPVLVTA